jgi:hypothetical protein
MRLYRHRDCPTLAVPVHLCPSLRLIADLREMRLLVPVFLGLFQHVERPISLTSSRFRSGVCDRKVADGSLHARMSQPFHQGAIDTPFSWWIVANVRSFLVDHPALDAQISTTLRPALTIARFTTFVKLHIKAWKS